MSSQCVHCGTETPTLKPCGASCCGRARGGLCASCYTAHAVPAALIDRFTDECNRDDPEAVLVLQALVSSDFGWAELRRWREAYVHGEWRPL